MAGSRLWGKTALSSVELGLNPHPAHLHVPNYASVHATPFAQNAAPALFSNVLETMTAYDDYGIPVDAYVEPEGLPHQAWRVARAFVIYRVMPRWRQATCRKWNWKKMLSLGRVLAVIWFFTIYWGERSVFNHSVESCRWENWENWQSDANPHRLVFVADPQLIDPHSYPGRPWPLNALTVGLSDLYLRRTYSRIQTVLYPDTVAFLGDLFDGGREWSTRTSQSPETIFRKYGNKFWLGEYARFGDIFFGHWGNGGMTPRPGQPGRKILSSLPGNHDLGFGQGIQTSVRKRFNAYFGDGNRVDIIGNHTFVSLDSVSLSAFGQENPEKAEELWKPTVDFLDGAKNQKQRLVHEELRLQQGLTRNLPFRHDVIEAHGLAVAELPKFNETVQEFPTILLTHVPLYRAEGTPCGPLREHWPPTSPPKGQTEPLDKDDRNAIAVRGGYQYQNVLHREITKDIAEKVGNIQYAFSGDDHDYCEVVHRGYASAGGGIKEITVKSTSMAMGVRKPGVVLASLWNPVDEHGSSLEDPSSTLQTHLCLFPDQLGIFVRYATLGVISVLALAIRAALIASGKFARPTYTADTPLLPTTSHASSAEHEKAGLSSQAQGTSHAPMTSNSSSTSDRGHLYVRNHGRTGSLSPKSGYASPTTPPKYTYPLVQHAGYRGPEDEDRREPKAWGTASTQKGPKKKGLALFIRELSKSVLSVGGFVVGWYLLLIWNG